MRFIAFFVFTLFTFALNELSAQAIIISAPEIKEKRCGTELRYRASYTITPVSLKEISSETKRIEKELKAGGATYAWTQVVRPGESYAIALVTRKKIEKKQECVWTTVMWRVTGGKDAVEKLDRAARNEPYYFSHSIQESKVLK